MKRLANNSNNFVDSFFSSLFWWIVGISSIPTFIIAMYSQLPLVIFLSAIWLLAFAVLLIIYFVRTITQPEEISTLSLENLETVSPAPISTIVKPIESGKQEENTTEQPPPNIVCLGVGDIFATLGKREVFTEVNADFASYRLVIAEFCNLPNSPQKIGKASKVQAQIRYYGLSEPQTDEWITTTVRWGCWLEEETPFVSFDINTVHHLILGVFGVSPDSDGHKKHFTIFENNPNPNKELSELKCTGAISGYQIKVTLIVGEYGEYSKDIDFEIEIERDFSSFSIVHLTEEKKQERKRYAIQQLEVFANEGRKVLAEFDENDKDFYSKVNDWRWKVEAFIRERIGRTASHRFMSVAKLQKYPDLTSEYNQQWLDELYTRILNLEQIVVEEKKSLNPNHPIQATQTENSDKRKYKIDRLKELISQREKLFINGYAPVSEVQRFNMGYIPRVEKFLAEYFDDSYVKRFQAHPKDALEEFLKELLA